MSNSADGFARLEELHIRSLGVIDEAKIAFAPGLTVLSGETGAGKTMVLTALNLVLGGKADSSFIRKGSERLSLSALFSLPKRLIAEFEDAGAEIESDEVILSRSLTQEGKSRAMLGGTLSTATKVSELAEGLIQIHGQSTNHRLAKPHVQRELLDGFLKDKTPLSNYSRDFDLYNELAKRIRDLKSEIVKRDDQIAELQEFIKAFNEVSPEPGELLEIENEISRLSSVEEINESLSAMLNLLESDDFNVLTQLQMAKRAGESSRGKDSALDALLDAHTESIFELDQATSDLVSYLGSLEANPSQFEYLQQRKAAINSLIKKFGTGSDKAAAFDEIVERGARSTERLNDLNGGDEQIAALEKELASHFLEMKKSALALSASRSGVAEELSSRVSEELHELSMPHAHMFFEVTQSNPDLVSSYSATGIDEVKILFSAHKGGDPLPLSKVASGGELSRVMLALEVVLASQSTIGTYVFDEVDSGVGGKAAFEIGRRLKKLAKGSQVIVVTHLPQVAVWGDAHYVVKKDESGSVTASDVLPVSGDERVTEVARLMSGQESSESAREHALELLNLASKE